MLYFHSYRNPGLVLDIIQDIRRLNDIAVKSFKTGVIILGSLLLCLDGERTGGGSAGGGLVKHHILNANLMRNGAAYAVIVSTGQEFDGSDSGPLPSPRSPAHTGTG